MLLTLFQRICVICLALHTADAVATANLVKQRVDGVLGYLTLLGETPGGHVDKTASINVPAASTTLTPTVLPVQTPPAKNAVQVDNTTRTNPQPTTSPLPSPPPVVPSTPPVQPLIRHAVDKPAKHTSVPPNHAAAPVDSRPAADDEFSIIFKNNCEETLWPALGVDVTSDSSVFKDVKPGFELPARQSHSIQIPIKSVLKGARIWARQKCEFSSGTGTCAIGGCSTNTLFCTTNTGVEKVTLVEFTLEAGGNFWYNLSLLTGFNLGIEMSMPDVSGTTSDSYSLCPTLTCLSTKCSFKQAYLQGESNNPVGHCTTHKSKVFKVEFCPSL